MTPQPTIRIARIYADVSPTDGARVLVDRLWPRGMRKDAAGLDEWCREIAPSTELRRWYGHRPDRFDEFDRRYRAELDSEERREMVRHLAAQSRSGTLTLLTAARDPEQSHLVVLADVLRDVEA